MKLSDCIARFLAEEGITHAFALSGGASLHLIHSIAETEGIDFICPQHEQAGAMAADGFSRMSGKMGCAIATSGPGATNLITGIASAYYDSVPVLYLTGNVATFRARGDTGVRQIGFQETDFVAMVRTITNYAVLIDDPRRSIYEIQKALYLARRGRPGPVVIDIPDDLQRMDIDPRSLELFTPPEDDRRPVVCVDSEIDRCLAMLREAKRPVLVLGWGIRLSGCAENARQLIDLLNIPTAFTWAVRDLIAHEHPLNVGGFGTHGIRSANFAVQNADLVLSIGSRLDTKATGSPPSSFARGAKIAMVEIDPTEIGKFQRLERKIDLPIVSDAGAFIGKLTGALSRKPLPDITAWRSRVQAWQKEFPVCLPEYYQEVEVNPYVLMEILSEVLQEGDVLFSDTACALAWPMQAFRFKTGQRFFHAFNYTPMGYGLPAAIGASFAAPERRIIYIAGDGSLQMNIQELITVIRHNLPIKILLINNKGHGMVQQTQEQWLEGKYYATSIEGGLGFPDFKKVAQAYGFKTASIASNAEIRPVLDKSLSLTGPVFVDMDISAAKRVIPQVQFGYPNEDATPLLDRDLFLREMIVDPLPISLKEI